MGTDCEGRLLAGGKGDIKVDLASDRATFRGAFKGEVSYGEMTVTEDGPRLLLAFRGIQASLELGKKTATWADKIRNPPSRLAKLGVEPGAVVWCIGAATQDILVELGPAVRKGWPTDKVALQLLFVSKLEALVDIPRAARLIGQGGALWVVYPKGRKDIRENDIIQAGRDTGLKDVKVLRFDDERTALRFVYAK